MSADKYIATATVTVQIEFEDDGELALEDQAHEAVVGRFDWQELLDSEVCQITSSPAKQAEEQTR